MENLREIGLRPELRWGSSQRSPNPLAGGEGACCPKNPTQLYEFVLDFWLFGFAPPPERKILDTSQAFVCLPAHEWCPCACAASREPCVRRRPRRRRLPRQPRPDRRCPAQSRRPRTAGGRVAADAPAYAAWRCSSPYTRPEQQRQRLNIIRKYGKYACTTTFGFCLIGLLFQEITPG